MIALPTDAELVAAAADTYVSRAVPFVSNLGGAGRVFLTTRSDGLRIFAMEGTHDPVGWLLDFFALRAWDHPTVNHKTLGLVHAGFYGLARVLLPKILEAVGRGGPFALAGHSLGGGLALLIGGLLIDRGYPPAKIGAFAPPRVGGPNFVSAIANVPFCAYRYGDDPVTQVPFKIPYLFPYSQVPLTCVGTTMIDKFLCHFIGNYVGAVKS